jgi:hypothetical protein
VNTCSALAVFLLLGHEVGVLLVLFFFGLALASGNGQQAQVLWVGAVGQHFVLKRVALRAG